MSTIHSFDESAYEMGDGEDAYDGPDAHVSGLIGDDDVETEDDNYTTEDADEDDDMEEEEEEDIEVADDEEVGLADEADAAELELDPEEGFFLHGLLRDTIQPIMHTNIINSDQNTMLQNMFALLRSSTYQEQETRPMRSSRRHQDTEWQTWWKKPHKEPQPVGVALLNSGEFGYTGKMQRGGRNLASVLRERRTTYRPRPRQDLIEGLVPNSSGTVVANYPSSVYCGQYSADASFYYVCCKDFNLHIYDMTAPPRSVGNPILAPYNGDSGHVSTMKVHKSIRGFAEAWTITDSHLSPDNDRMIYSSLSPVVHMIKTRDDDVIEVSINFDDRQARGRRHGYGWSETCLWSCRFSADGNEIIASGRQKLFVYDLIADWRTVSIKAHEDDINSCCWADQGANVLVSASDDSFLKVWDRRALGASARPSGVLIGHTEGITNVSAKGDGRYVISNGKDQALRLWDLRKMAPDSAFEAVRHQNYGLDGFDYRRCDDTRPQNFRAHPNDCSIMTYRGHSVMRTLIRCYFSPAETTGSRYIYSGSFDGRIHIWSLDGRLVQVLDRSESMPITFDPSGPEFPATKHMAGSPCVRDVSWSSQEPVMLSAAWGVESTSSVARHEWKGLSKMAGRLEDWADKMLAEEVEVERRRPAESRWLRRDVQ